VVNAPQLWVALLRIVAGALVLEGARTRFTAGLLGGIVPYPAVSSRFLSAHARRVAELAVGNPLDWYKSFLDGTVRPHVALFARLETYGEVLVGVSLVLGLLVGLGALIGLVLSVGYGLAAWWTGFTELALHALLVASMLVFLGARAGRVMGLDALIARRVKRRWVRLLV
jgi:uncharacterized membrane protein YphA (DoxX/SURF4 family)